MTVQLEIVRFRDLLTVEAIPRFVPGLPSPTVEIKGEDFRSVEEVRINEVPAPEFMVVNRNTLWAVLPGAAQSGIKTIEVLSSNFTKTNRFSKLDFQIGNKSRKTEGILKLVQLFTMWLLKSPGTDIFKPDQGGGLQEIVGKITSTRNMAPILSAVTRSVQTTTTQIRAAQLNQSQLPIDERLLSAEVIDLNIYEEQMEARLKIRVNSVAGRKAVAELGL